ncbi:MAG: sigma factor-like helix-turn-helix DNA-binding protein [Acidithiobacillus sp.]
MEFDGFDMEVTMAERDVDEENPWTDEDQAAYVTHVGNPVTYADIERREAEFRAWARGQDWAKSPEARVISRAELAVSQVVGPVSRTENPAHHTLGGGDDSGDSDSSDGDADSHVLTYFQHLNSLICWSSALEVLSPIFSTKPASTTLIIGNHHVDLADYPNNYTPDYSFQTLVRAARDAGYLSDPVTLDLALKSTNPSPFYKQFSPAPALLEFTCEDDKAENLADRPIGNIAILEGWDQKDLATRMRDLDPDNRTYQCCKITAEKCFRSWIDDQMHDEMVLAAWQDGYVLALRCFNPAHADSARSYQSSFATYAHILVRDKAGRDVIKKNKFYVTGKEILAEIKHREAKLSRPFLSGAERESLTEELEFLQVAKGRNFLIKRTESLDAPLELHDSDGGQSTTGLDLLESEDAGGEHKITQWRLVDHLLSQLSAIAQGVVRAKYYEELTHKEIADRMDIPFHKVTTILAAAKASMAATVRGMGINAGDCL